MGRDDWYRNTNWNAEIAAHFFVRLKRARDKSQRLRIQACMLAESHPEAALMLLEQYFATGDHFHRASAYVDQATAYRALGNVEKALESYESALAREREYPRLKTQAGIEFAFLIASAGLRDKYERAIQVLNEHRSQLMFPRDRFRWHASHALIYEAEGNRSAAREYAQAALEQASAEHSGFRYHPSIGLVGSDHMDLRTRLADLADDPRPFRS